MLKLKSTKSLLKAGNKLVFGVQRTSSSDKHAKDDHEHHAFEPSYKINMGPYPFPIPHEHHEHYDFRDDPNYNEELSFPTGFTQGLKWKFPYEGKDEWYFQGYDEYNPYDTKQAFQPQNSPKNYTHLEYQVSLFLT